MLWFTHSAIRLMEQAAASGARESQCVVMARSALERLFKANLPAKYWVTGTLDMTDSTVGTEFFDAGPVSTSWLLLIDMK